MSENINNQIFKTSHSIDKIKISEDRFAVWNRYSPKVVFLNKDSIELLELLKDNKDTPYKEFVGFKRILKKFIKSDLLYSQRDDFKEKYIKAGEDNLERISNDFKKNISERLQYNEFLVNTNKCNLRCSYCVCDYIKKDYHEDAKKNKKERVDRLIKCIEKNLDSNVGNRKLRSAINFNGGEILLQKDIVKHVVDHVKTNYPEKEISFNVNTNGTLIDDKTAKFLTDNFDTIALSFDAHEEAHNQTRVYENGKGSFNDVMNGHKLIRKYRKDRDTTYQGTVIPAHDLDIAKIEKMKEFGFESARLGTDVLHISPSEAKEMAKKCFDLSIESKEAGIWTKDSFFKAYNDILKNDEKKGKFNFFCNGFDIGFNYLFYNIDNETIKLACSFAANLEVKLDDIDDDIHHPLLYEKIRDFLVKRYEVIKENCMDCPVVSLCKGGCVMTGIDPFNSLNESACTFQKETWKHFVGYLSEKKLKN